MFAQEEEKNPKSNIHFIKSMFGSAVAEPKRAFEA
jgi:hypothetical protein